MIFIGSDHAGFELKEYVLSVFPSFINVGTYSQDSCDYPIIANNLCHAVLANEGGLGILICGSGTGMCIAANKHNKIRAANCWAPEIARLAREHNNSNVLTLGARFLSNKQAIDIIEAFINTNFSLETRHIRRINMFE